MLVVGYTPGGPPYRTFEDGTDDLETDE